MNSDGANRKWHAMCFGGWVTEIPKFLVFIDIFSLFVILLTFNFYSSYFIYSNNLSQKNI